MSNLDIVKEAYSHFANGNFSAILSNLAQDVQWIEAEKNLVIIGRDEVSKNIFNKLHKDYTLFQVIPEKFIDAGEHIIVFSRYSCISKSSNLRKEIPVAQVITMENHKVIQYCEYVGSESA
ncbi:hypothetical protein [Pseudalkalibacillus sp. SCS-8]|uniref:nuclear transport factor 2 family protein n=1 Tax=Pseudalkalibacillus nanhaiensis TaxID=3115291 RepID=UPI0032DB07AB